jgi:hypothetical protein
MDLGQIYQDISHSARVKRLRGKVLIEENGCSGEYAQDNCSCII